MKQKKKIILNIIKSVKISKNYFAIIFLKGMLSIRFMSNLNFPIARSNCPSVPVYPEIRRILLHISQSPARALTLISLIVNINRLILPAS